MSRFHMLWVACWIVVTVVGLLSTIASFNSVRFSRRVADDMRAIASPTSAPASRNQGLAVDLPAPVERYIRKAVVRSSAIRTVRLRHGGRFRPSPNGSWLSIRGEQCFRADPPAFVWWGRARLLPGVWVDARDRSVDGAGNMFVTAESTITLANSTGPQLDQGALLRLLGEMTWFPTVLLDARYVRWSAVDEHRAGATLRVGGREVTGVFEFGADDLPATFAAERFRAIGGGEAVLTPFVGRYMDYRPVENVLVPHRVVAAWVIDDRPVEYVDFLVDRLEFDS